MLSNNDYEKKVVTDFLTHAQSTHNMVVSNSVGMAIRQLKNVYYGDDVTDELLADNYNNCIRELNNIHGESTKSSIQHIIALTKENIKNDFDTVTLFVPSESTAPDEKGNMETTMGYADVKFVIPLSTVLPIVWRALNDNAKYTHHYQGTEAEKINQAAADLPQRLESFYLCLKRIRDNEVCHHGSRNELD
jgi:hypothetical protein